MRCAVLVIVILSVSPSVTPVDCIHVVRSTIMVFSQCGSRMILVFTARRYAEPGICYANSVRPSVRPSVCLVTRVYCIKTAERIIEILSLSDRPLPCLALPYGGTASAGPMYPPQR